MDFLIEYDQFRAPKECNKRRPLACKRHESSEAITAVVGDGGVGRTVLRVSFSITLAWKFQAAGSQRARWPTHTHTHTRLSMYGVQTYCVDVLKLCKVKNLTAPRVIDFHTVKSSALTIFFFFFSHKL